VGIALEVEALLHVMCAVMIAAHGAITFSSATVSLLVHNMRTIRITLQLHNLQGECLARALHNAAMLLSHMLLQLAAMLNCAAFLPALPLLPRHGLLCRLMGDENASTQGVLQAYNIMEVPTFLFFKNGKEVGRHVGSSRGDLIGKILQVSRVHRLHALQHSSIGLHVRDAALRAVR
jgi:hypothetical protein